MKKLLILLVFAFVGTTMTAQNYSPGVDKIAAQDLQIMEVKISSKYPNLAFNPAQKEQLMAVLLKRAKELHVIKSTEGISKEDYSVAHMAIVKKYEEEIAALLSAEQKAVYTKRKREMTRGL